MNSKNKGLFVIGLIAALVVGFLVGISVDFPKTKNSDLTGTFGKAEKFRKVRMTPKDIQLRSELLKDTAKLKSMIQGLVYFSVFTEDVCSNIETSLLAFKHQGMGQQPGEAEQINSLKDYSDFIRNNNQTLNATIALLSGYYLKDTADLSQDVEKKLRDFSSYVTGLNQKSNVLVQSLTSMDNFMLGNKTLKEHQEALKQLKSVRDQLLIRGVQLGSLTNNRDMVNTLLQGALMSQEKFNLYQGKEQLNQFLGKEQLQFFSQENMQALLFNKDLGIVFDRSNLEGKNLIVYDRVGLQFVGVKTELGVTARQDLNITNSNIQALCYTVGSAGKLEVVLSNYSLQNLFQSSIGSSPLGMIICSNLFANGDMQAVFNAAYGFFSVGAVFSHLGIYI